MGGELRVGGPELGRPGPEHIPRPDRRTRRGAPPTGPAAADSAHGPNVPLKIGGRQHKLIKFRSVIHTERAGGGDAPDKMGLLNITDGKPQGLRRVWRCPTRRSC